MKKVLNFLKKYYLCFIIVAASIIIDLLTKYIATKNLYVENNYLSKEVIKNFFYFTYARNSGAAWSILTGKTVVLIIITVVAFVFFGYFLRYFDIKKRPFYSIGFALMLGGTLGNFYERIVNGYVTDFFDFIIFGWDFPIFNVADSCLVVGMILIIVYFIFFSKDDTIFKEKNNPLKEKEVQDTKEENETN